MPVPRWTKSWYCCDYAQKHIVNICGGSAVMLHTEPSSYYSDHLWQQNSKNTCWFLDTALFLSLCLLQTALYALMSIHFLSLIRFRAGVYSSFYGTMWTDRRSIAKRCGSENFLWQTLLEEMPSHFNSLICLTVTSLLLPSTQKSVWLCTFNL